MCDCRQPAPFSPFFQERGETFKQTEDKLITPSALFNYTLRARECTSVHRLPYMRPEHIKHTGIISLKSNVDAFNIM